MIRRRVKGKVAEVVEPMTMERFGKEMERVHSDIKQIIGLFYTYLSMHNAAVENPKIYRAYNDDAYFRNMQLYALQQSMFIVLGPIIGNAGDMFNGLTEVMRALQGMWLNGTRRTLGEQRSLDADRIATQTRKALSKRVPPDIPPVVIQ